MNEILKDDLKYIKEYDLPYELLKGKTVLVTGATGLIGVSLVRSLLYMGDIKVLAFVRNENKAKSIYEQNSNLEIVIGDIINPIDIIETVDYIFHCASVTTSKIMVEQPVETLMTSIEGTKHILNLAKEKRCKSVV